MLCYNNNERIGVFASRAPYRPNSLGLSCVKLEKIEINDNGEKTLLVSGVDIMDKTPIYDIKPYIPYCDSKPEALGSYAEENKDYSLKAEFPERKIHSIDSLGASLGEGLLTLRIAKLRDEGKSFEEIVEWAEENKHNVMHWFTVNDLQYLHRGGRVSKTTAIVGTLLDIKPVLPNTLLLVNIKSVLL